MYHLLVIRFSAWDWEDQNEFKGYILMNKSF